MRFFALSQSGEPPITIIGIGLVHTYTRSRSDRSNQLSIGIAGIAVGTAVTCCPPGAVGYLIGTVATKIQCPSTSLGCPLDQPPTDVINVTLAIGIITPSSRYLVLHLRIIPCRNIIWGADTRHFIIISSN